MKTRTSIRTVMLIALCAIQLCVRAQYQDLKFVHLTTEQGLSNSDVFSIIQDQKGFIWFGTADGLDKFDGYSIRVYKHNDEDTTSLINNTVNSLYADSKGHLWVGTAGGISRFNPDTDNFTNYVLENDFARRDVSLNRIKGIAEDTRSNLFIANEKGRLYKFNPENKSFVTETTVQTPPIRTMAIDDNNNIWLGTFEGLIFYDTEAKRITNYNKRGKGQFYIDDAIETMLTDKDELWIGTFSNGVKVVNRANGEIKNYEPVDDGATRVYKLYKDALGNLWAGDAEGLKLLDKTTDKFWSYNSRPGDRSSLITAGVRAIFRDKQGNVWAATSFGGINIAYTGKAFLHLRNNPDLPLRLTTNIISALYEDENENLWAGSFNQGIDVLNLKSGTTKHFENIPGNLFSLSETTIHTIYEDINKNIWIGSFRGGLQRYDKASGKFITYTNTKRYPEFSADIRCIVQDKHGYLWLMTHGTGAVKFDPETRAFHHYINSAEGKPYCFPDNWGFMFFIDADDILWAATPSGLGKINFEGITEKLYQYAPNDSHSLSNNMVICLAEDSQKNLWVGTEDGLNLFDKKNGKFFRLSKKEGLANSVIKAIQEDKAGNIWVSTDNGLSRIAVNKSSDSITYKIKNFDMRDGLQGNEFFERSFYKSRSTGQMFFGGNNGITAFFPDSIRDNPYIPPVVLTDFKLFYRSVSIGVKDSPLQKHVSETKRIELLYSQNVITFEFAALNYVIPEKNQYAYTMEGFDKTWNYVGTEHKATYTNLDPGHYVFRVKASNNDGIWNEEGTTISIYIHPPFWVTDWAFAFYAVMIISVLYYTYRSVVAREKLKSRTAIERLDEKRAHEMDLMKIRFFTNVSHELRTPITLILGPLQRLMHSSIKDTQTISYYSLMHRNAQRLLRMVNQLLDFRKLETGHMKLEAMRGDIVMFVKSIAGAFNYNAVQRNITYTVQSSVDSLQLWFDPDKLDKILYNIISNAFKYTEDDGNIDICLDVKTENEREYVQISIKDNGVGIPKDSLPDIFTLFYQVEGSKSGTGIGLALAKEMIELHHGKIEVDSELCKGSHFKVLLPLGKDHLHAGQIVERDIDMEEKIAAIELAPSIIAEEVHDMPVDTTGKPIVLIIDDDEDIRQYLRDILSSSYRVIEAINSETGFDAAVKEIPDLIISDVMMPGVDGFKLCTMIKGDERTNHVPIILLTAKGAEESKIEGFETGADDFITKPFSDALLLARVKNLIQSRKKLKELFGKTTGAQLIQEEVLDSLDKKFIEKAIHIVEAHLADTNFDSHAFAQEIGMSRAQLYRKFSAITNQSVFDFIKNIRLKKAADMLARENKSIAETAYAVGFSERTNFTRTFVKHFGVTPSQYVAAQKIKSNQS